VGHVTSVWLQNANAQGNLWLTPGGLNANLTTSLPCASITAARCLEATYLRTWESD